MIAITLLGTGSPMPDPDRAGPATLIQAGGENYVVDCGRGVVMRLVAAGVAPGAVTAVLVTHLHSDHITDLGDIITTQWVTTFEPTPLRIVGPPGIRATVDHIVASLGPDIGYRIAHHDDLNRAPLLVVTEVVSGPVELGGSVAISAGPTDHKPVDPSIGFRFDHEGTAVVVAGDTVPCAGLDELCAGSDALVHTVIRKDIIADIPIQRLQDTLDYHSSPAEAAQTAARAGVGTLVLTHYVPAFPSGGGDDWKALAAEHFAGRIELGDDLHRVEIEHGRS
jgi:ribonuclease Z